MRDTFARTLHRVAKVDPRVFIVVADISPAGSMAPFREEFPDRFINVGVAEQSMIGICAGLAMRGCTPFAYTIATFTTYRPFEHVRDDLCYQDLPVTLVGIGGGMSYSTLGGTHHAQEDIAVMGALPNMSIVAPCDPLETEAATWACAEHRHPIYLRLGKAGEPDLTSQAVEPFAFGKLRMIRDGGAVCVISYGPILRLARDAADRIGNTTGERVALFSAHTLKPLDRERLAQLLMRFETVVIVEEHSEIGGLAAQAKQVAWESGAHPRLLTFSLKDEFIHIFGSQEDLWRAHGISVDRVCEAVLDRRLVGT
jgi:transketolase